jgi:hypothetical protein
VEITTDDSEAAVHCGSTIVSVKCIILSMIEGTNDGASKGEHSGHVVKQMGYASMRARAAEVGATDHSLVNSS